MTKIESEKWWFKNSKTRFKLTRFYVEKFDDLKEIFKFKNEDFILFIKREEIKNIIIFIFFIFL